MQQQPRFPASSQMFQGSSFSSAPTVCSSINSCTGSPSYEINTPVVKVDLYMVISSATSMTSVIDAIRTQIGKCVKELKNPIDYSAILNADLDEQTDNHSEEETNIREKVDHKLDMRVGLCFYGGLNEKVLTKELTEHIPGLQLFIG
jgi:hypothetical protein